MIVEYFYQACLGKIDILRLSFLTLFDIAAFAYQVFVQELSDVLLNCWYENFLIYSWWHLVLCTFLFSSASMVFHEFLFVLLLSRASEVLKSNRFPAEGRGPENGLAR